MSYAAMNYVRKLKRETGIVNTLKHVLMMIAWRIPPGHMESKPTSLRWLADSVGCDERTVRRCRDQLVAKHKVLTIGARGRGRSRFQTYFIPNLAGPLFAIDSDDGKPGSVSRLKSGQPVTLDAEKRTSAPTSGVATPFFSESVRTEVPTTTTETPVAAMIYERVLGFLDWFAQSYPTHHNGAAIAIDFERDGPVVKRLLEKPPRDVARLQAMAVVMWTVTPDEDPWLPRATERGVKLLVHAADRLDRISRVREVAPKAEADARGHVPPCRTWTECTRRFEAEIAERRQAGGVS